MVPISGPLEPEVGHRVRLNLRRLNHVFALDVLHTLKSLIRRAEHLRSIIDSTPSLLKEEWWDEIQRVTSFVEFVSSGTRFISHLEQGLLNQDLQMYLFRIDALFRSFTCCSGVKEFSRAVNRSVDSSKTIDMYTL